MSITPSSSPSDYSFNHEIRVRFVETDAMGIVHHSNYLHYFEEARVAYLAAIGHPFTEWRDAGLESPVLESFVTYKQPLRFDDVATVHLNLAAVTKVTFQLAYLITTQNLGSLDEANTMVCAGGVTVHGCTTAAGRPTRLPAWMSEIRR